MNVCVFCGSSMGNSDIYAKAAHELGTLIAQSKSTLVYGGGNVGLMGVVADAVMEHGGEVIGVIPDFLVRREVAHKGITQLEVVDSMHERKKRMADLSHAFVALPGGWGTLDELAEILTWKQLGLIESTIGILNIQSFFDSLLEQMRQMSRAGFLQESSLQQLKVAKTPSEMLIQIGIAPL
ncbi:MAG: TIGR00730 family Rossman fold protein [Flammeovirgaceae bacterium]